MAVYGAPTLEDAIAELAELKAAKTKVLKGQAYSLNGRSMTRANLSEIDKSMDRCIVMINKLSRRGLKARFVTPV